jgi:hypothetical protein
MLARRPTSCAVTHATGVRVEQSRGRGQAGASLERRTALTRGRAGAGEVAGALGRGLKEGRRCPRMAWAVAERRMTATTRRVPLERLARGVRRAEAGDPEVHRPFRGPCDLRGCGAAAGARGRARGVGRKKRPRLPCVVAGCGRLIQRRNYCIRHLPRAGAAPVQGAGLRPERVSLRGSPR